MSKLCCIDCFTPETVKKYIKDNGIGRGQCHFCKERSPHCIEPEKLSHLFLPIISLYSRIEEFMPLELMKEFEGQTLIEKLIEDWEPFTNDDYDLVSELMDEMFDNGDPFDGGIDFDGWVERADWYWGRDESEELKSNWEVFCEEIIYKNRYFPQESINLDFLGNLQHLQRKVKKNTYYYRSRKSDNSKRIMPKYMGMPPAHLSSPGRANPKGIPYLYLATDSQTAIHEVRPNTDEYITIGRFKVIEDLKMFDLSNQIQFDPYSCGDELGEILELLSFLNMLSNDLSKPIDKNNKDLDYIPTQYLCEFIKHKGFDGVVYKSNVGLGVNIALFDDKKVKCTRTNLYELEAKANKITA